MSSEEQTWLANHGPLLYAPDPSFPPFEWIGEDGTIHGIAPELLELLAKRLHTSIQPVKIDSWSHVLRASKEGRIDLLGCISATEERKAYLTFTNSYISSTLVGFVRVDSKLDTVADLKGHRVGVVQDYVAYERLIKELQGFTIVPVSSTREGMAMLALGKIDAMIETLGVGSFVITHEAIEGLRILPGELRAHPQSYSIASPNPLVARLMQKALDSVDEAEISLLIK